MTLSKWIAVACGLVAAVAIGLYVNARSGLVALDDDARSRAPGEFVELSDGQVHFAWHGPETGPVTVLVHGFSTPSFVWTGILGPLTDAGMRVLTYDHYGRGFSDRPHGTYDAARFERQLLELLASQSVSEPVDLVGYSMGGAIVAHFTANHAEQVRRIALIAPAGFATNAGAIAKLLRIPLIGDWLVAVVGRQTLLDVMALPENQGRALPDITERYEDQMRYEGYLRALLATLRDFPMGAMDAEFERVGKSEIPVLSIWGRLDNTIPIENAERLTRAVPQAEVEIIEEGTHAITYSEPERVSTALIAFFGRPDALARE
jgi:pimeloyl-ACP methyl ester carboxylesterase